MADILFKIEKMLESTVRKALSEEARERGIQLQTSKEIEADRRSLRAGDGDQKVDEADEDEEEKSSGGGDMSKRPVEIPDKLPAAITVDMVIDGIDAIRSARSLKDPEVRAEFEEYFGSLSAPEKVGLLAFIYGVAETLIGSSEGRGLDPSEEPYNIEMTADPAQSDEPSKTPAPAARKNDPGDTPIVVGGQ
jgi:hypothetical protein